MDARLPPSVVFAYASSTTHALPRVGSVLTPPQRYLHVQGLAASAYLFAHVQVPVWIQSRVSPSGMAHEHGMENLHKQDTMHTLNRGLCLLHLHLASLMVSTLGAFSAGIGFKSNPCSHTLANYTLASPCCLSLAPIASYLALSGTKGDSGHWAPQAEHPHRRDS